MQEVKKANILGNLNSSQTDQKSNFWSKIELLAKNRIFGKKLNFREKKSKFWSKIELLDKNRIFGPKLNFRPQIEILVKIDIFG